MVRLVVNFVFLTMSTFQPVSFSSQLNIIFLKRQKQFIVSLTYEVFYTIKILGLPKAGSLLVEDNKWQRSKKRKKKKEMKKQANINISISYLVLLMFLDSIELIYNWKFLIIHTLEYLVFNHNSMYLRRSSYVLI